MQLTAAVFHPLRSLTNRRSRRLVVVVMLLLGVLVSGLGARAITQAERARLRARAERPQRYTLDIAGDRPHYIVDFHTSDAVVGTDLYGLPRRREALEASRDLGTAVASRWYLTVTDLDRPIERQRTLTLIAVPVYQGGRTPATVAQRRRSLIGWLVAPLFASEVLDDVASDLPVNLELRDRRRSTVPIAAVDHGRTAIADDLPLEVLGREWNLRIGLTDDLTGRTVPPAAAVLIAGVCLTVLLTALYWLTSRLGAQSESRASTATARLRERERYVRVIAERVPVGIADLDAAGHILWANTQLAEVVGLQVDRLIGLPWSDLVHPEDREAVTAAHVAAVADGEAFLVRHRLHEAQERWIEKAGAPTFDDEGDVIRVLAVVSDASATVRFEDRLRAARDQAVEASRIKSEFLANLSHEIRTPLNGVIGMAEVLSTTELSDGQRSKLAILRTAATQLRVLLNDLLDLSTIEAGRLELDDVEFDPTETFASVAGLHAPAALGTMLDLRVDLDDALPARVRGPKLRLRQVLNNLLRHAVTCTHHGEVRLAANVVERRPGMVRVRLDVTDAGVGISAAMIESVFDPFRHADAPDTPLHGASGLGLAISRQLVEMMGGRLQVESTTNRGNRVTVTVPLEVVQDAAPTPTPAAAAADGRAVPASTTRPASDADAPAWRRAGVAEAPAATLLVVEDNPINQEVARELLATLGYDAEVVRDGAEGVEAVRTGRFAAVLMDCQMPVMDGYEATARIRALESAEDRRTPIIAMTAEAMVGDRQRCLAAGMDDYITKPVSLDVLAETLARWVGVRAPAADLGAAAGGEPDPLEQVVDWQFLHQLAAVPGLLERSRTQFLESGHDELSQMRRLVEAGDVLGLQAAAHRLRGASLTLGAMRLGALLHRIEETSVDAPGAVATLFEDVVAAFSELREALLTSDTAP